MKTIPLVCIFLLHGVPVILAVFVVALANTKWVRIMTVCTSVQAGKQLTTYLSGQFVVYMVTLSLFKFHSKLKIVIDVPVCNRIVDYTAYYALTHR